MIYIKRSVMILEPMADQSVQIREREEKRKFRAELKNTLGKRKREEKEERNGGEGEGDDDGSESDDDDVKRESTTEKKPKKNRGPKGVNPLAMKKKKSQQLPKKDAGKTVRKAVKPAAPAPARKVAVARPAAAVKPAVAVPAKARTQGASTESSRKFVTTSIRKPETIASPKNRRTREPLTPGADNVTMQDGRYALPATTRIPLPNGYRPSAKDEYMSPRQLQYFRDKLSKWREELVEESRQTIESLRDEVRDVGDEAERATRETENSLELRTRDRYRKLIAKIDKALKRIEEGRYGFCEETDEEIGIERLEARPIATLSLDAQERWEHRQKQMGD